MKFSSMLLFFDDEYPDKKKFSRLLEIGNKQYRKGKFLYSIEQKFYGENYFVMYFQYDNEKLYSNVVVDTVDNSEKDNPRPKSQIELRNQLFACYDFKNKLLYVSDYGKKGVVTDYISYMLQTVEVKVKNVYATLEDFVSVYKRLKSATFTQIPNISTTMPNSIFRQQAHLYGYDLPERSKLKVEYGLAPVGMAKNVLQDWKMKHETGEYDEVVLVGVDDAGFESSFNFSSMIAAVEIDLLKDENDRYDPTEVWSRFLARIEV